MIALKLFKPILAKHSHYLDPWKFAQRLIEVRNSRLKNLTMTVKLSQVLVYRGLPSPLFDSSSYSRNLNQAAFWELNRGLTVIHRPLKYIFQKNPAGEFELDSAGKRVIQAKKEKGIDVLCALALVRETRKSNLVVLASHDSDLVPALDEALSLQMARIETTSWYFSKNRRSLELRPETQRVWNTRLDEHDFISCLDHRNYG